MKNKQLLSIIAIAVLAACYSAGCGKPSETDRDNDTNINGPTPITPVTPKPPKQPPASTDPFPKENLPISDDNSCATVCPPGTVCKDKVCMTQINTPAEAKQCNSCPKDYVCDLGSGKCIPGPNSPVYCGGVRCDTKNHGFCEDRPNGKKECVTTPCHLGCINNQVCDPTQNFGAGVCVENKCATPCTGDTHCVINKCVPYSGCFPHPKCPTDTACYTTTAKCESDTETCADWKKANYAFSVANTQGHEITVKGELTAASIHAKDIFTTPAALENIIGNPPHPDTFVMDVLKIKLGDPNKTYKFWFKTTDRDSITYVLVTGCPTSASFTQINPFSPIRISGGDYYLLALKSFIFTGTKKWSITYGAEEIRDECTDSGDYACNGNKIRDCQAPQRGEDPMAANKLLSHDCMKEDSTPLSCIDNGSDSYCRGNTCSNPIEIDGTKAKKYQFSAGLNAFRGTLSKTSPDLAYPLDNDDKVSCKIISSGGWVTPNNVQGLPTVIFKIKQLPNHATIKVFDHSQLTSADKNQVRDVLFLKEGTCDATSCLVTGTSGTNIDFKTDSVSHNIIGLELKGPQLSYTNTSGAAKDYYLIVKRGPTSRPVDMNIEIAL